MLNEKASGDLVAMFALVISLDLRAGAAGIRSIPPFLLSGAYASTVQGVLAVCVSPTTSLEESCTTGGALVMPFTTVNAGQATADGSANSCGTYSEVQSNRPLGTTPPQVFTLNVVGKTLNYDPTSGTGDQSFTSYSGGNCNGATFDSTDATVVSSGTDHFVASGSGKRIDGIFTSLTDPAGELGDFSVSFINFKQ